jgi:HPr kinase/phosphorylase
VTVSRRIAVEELLEEKTLAFMDLEVLAGSAGLANREITNPRIQKPGLALAGYLPYVKPGRLQILGESEFAYLGTLGAEEGLARLARLVNLDVPCFISAKGCRPEPEIQRLCDERELPFMVTEARTSDVIEGLSAYLEDKLAPRKQMHGVLVDVFSLGTLILGDPGIGKSECALELVHRGHRLVADDIVVIRRTHDHNLRGGPHELLENFLELRGVGIIDVRKHFGMTATSPSITVSLIIRLMKLSPGAKDLEQKWRERLMEDPRWASTEEILGVGVPSYTMVVAPGRDLAILVETAVRKCLLAQRGIQDEREFLDTINQLAIEADANASGAEAHASAEVEANGGPADPGPLPEGGDD